MRVSYAGVPYLDRVAPLATGEVEVAGVELEFVEPGDLGTLFATQAREPEFDASEMSLSTYLSLVSRGDSKLVGLPIFPLRHFRHRHVYIHEEAGIGAPQDLRGKRVGVLEYEMTSALWIRAFLQHDYGVRPDELRWFAGGLRSPGYRRRTDHPLPAGVSLEVVPETETLEGMLFRGDLDALVTVEPPAAFSAEGPVRRLFPDYAGVEREYYERTRLFPIMHLVVVRREVLEEAPWVADALVEAFTRARALGRRRLTDADRAAVSLPWLDAHVEDADALFGGDPYPVGIEPNRRVLEHAALYAAEQEIAARHVALVEVFPR
jgi:4,5-dihydroxyphthalate decarboxylase